MEKIKTFWAKTKAWFKHSETILLARLEVVAGFVIGAVSAIDWTALESLDFGQAFTWNQFTGIGGAMIVKGIIAEIARRRNANL